jgi:hypothetical protein
LVWLAGCGGGLHPVRGKVLLDDGKPLTRGMVIFQATLGDQTLQADGEIHDDGSFQMRTNTPGDGVAPGTYKVVIQVPPLDSDKPMPPPFHPKYQSFAETDLQVTVKPQANVVELKLDGPAKRKGPPPR